MEERQVVPDQGVRYGGNGCRQPSHGIGYAPTYFLPLDAIGTRQLFVALQRHVSTSCSLALELIFQWTSSKSRPAFF